MRASVFAGLVGIVLVLLLLIVFYRRLTLLIAAGMVVWGMLIYSVGVLISQTTNYALTLAGVTGIIVSIGMTVDSYVVYFERMKDEVRHGRTFRNSAGRSFKSTWRTILAANLVSFIAAAVLFVLSVGSVRGFALYLGVTTICDVIVLWFFTRPAVILIADTGSARPPRPVRRSGLVVRTRRIGDASAGDLAPAAHVHARGPRRPSRSPQPRWRRLFLGQTAIDFWGKRRVVDGHLAGLLVITRVSLWQRASSSASTSRAAWPGTSRPGELTVDDARDVLDDNGIDGDTAKIQERNSDSGDIIKVQVEDQPETVRVEVQEAFAEAAGVDAADVSVAVGQRHVGRGDHAQGDHRPGRVPRPDRHLHLVPLRVADGPRRDRWR